MSWAIKVQLLQRSGKTREEALEMICRDLSEKNRDLDLKLAKALDYLTERQIREVVGDLSDLG